jgi:hypothetical protein
MGANTVDDNLSSANLPERLRSASRISPQPLLPSTAIEPESKSRLDQRAPKLERLRESLSQVFDGLAESWQPVAPESRCAWEIYIELRTRTVMQRRRYLDSDEATALSDLVRLTETTRNACRTSGPEAVVSTAVADLLLTQVLLPLTARWESRSRELKLNPEDLRREFRGELAATQEQLQIFCAVLYELATGQTWPMNNCPDPRLATVQRTPNQPTKLQESPCFTQIIGVFSTPKHRGADGAGVCQQDILLEETREIRWRRQAIGQPVPEQDPVRDLVGLAISGGGIRSATFSLGVIQALAHHGILKQVDFLSTVSGGGYAGCFLSTYLDSDEPGVGPGRGERPLSSENGVDSHAIRHIRDRSRYIQPRGFRDWVLTLAHGVYGIVSNLLILMAWVFLAVAATDCILGPQLQSYQSEAARLLGFAKQHALPPAHMQAAPPASDSATLAATDLLSGLAETSSLWWSRLQERLPEALTMRNLVGLSYALLALSLLVLPTSQRFLRACGHRFSRPLLPEKFVLRLLGLSLAGFLILSFPRFHFGYAVLMQVIGHYLKIGTAPGEGWSVTATVVTLANAAGLLVAQGPKVRSLAGRLPIAGGAMFLLLCATGPILILYTYFELCRVYVASPTLVPIFTIPVIGLPLYSRAWFLLLSFCCFLYSLQCNINFFSLHRFYRNRLADTFLLTEESDCDKTNSSERFGIRICEQQKLSKLRSKNEKSKAPYHLINAAVNLPGSKRPELRGRDCDFFLMSRHFCGGPVVGYRRTEDLEPFDSHFDLAAAMAISGAAAAPQMGVGTVRGASFLMTLLNVRLGYWLKWPRGPRWPAYLHEMFGGPGPLYLWQEAMNAMNEQSPFLNLSDGGHIENLAVMELLRRRCRLIIAIDGEHDPKLEFNSLRMLQRYASIDLGVEICIDCSRIEWTTMPIPADLPKHLSRNSQAHFALGKILYPCQKDDSETQPVGWLVYVKLSVTGNEADTIHHYRLKNAQFPHDPTLTDQVFEEDQFEAYRALGEHAGNDLFSEELLEELVAGSQPPSVSAKLQADWSTGNLQATDWVDALKAAFGYADSP